MEQPCKECTDKLQKLQVENSNLKKQIKTLQEEIQRLKDFIGGK